MTGVNVSVERVVWHEWEYRIGNGYGYDNTCEVPALFSDPDEPSPTVAAEEIVNHVGLDCDGECIVHLQHTGTKRRYVAIVRGAPADGHFQSITIRAVQP